MALTNEELQDIISNLSPEERKQLLSQLGRQVEVDNITNPTQSTNTKPKVKPKSDNSKVYCCPLCGSASYKKHGTTTSGMQRYICKDCGKTFSENYGDSLRYSHLTSDEWLDIIRGIVNNHSLPQIARDCGISKSTAWSCRMKINQAIMTMYGYSDMSYVCFYPDVSDVFKIGQIDGVCYYILDKVEHDKCKVVNKSRLQPYFNSENVRNIRSRQSLINVCNEIHMYIDKFQQYKIDSNKLDERYKYSVNKLFSLGGASPWDRVLLTIDGKCKVVGAGYLLENQSDYTAGVSQNIFSSDDKSECEAFISWINCKFTRFFLLCNISKLTVTFDNDYFRFVPAPPTGKFDHIYTDEELYKAFNLPQKYIDVIEAVIKERK